MTKQINKNKLQSKLAQKFASTSLYQFATATQQLALQQFTPQTFATQSISQSIFTQKQAHQTILPTALIAALLFVASLFMLNIKANQAYAYSPEEYSSIDLGAPMPDSKPMPSQTKQTKQTRQAPTPADEDEENPQSNDIENNDASISDVFAKKNTVQPGRFYANFAAGLSGVDLTTDYGATGGTIHSSTGLMENDHPAISIAFGYKMDKFEHWGIAAEVYTQWSFGSYDLNIAPTGESTNNYASLAGDGYQYVGGFLKPFIALCDKKINIYALVGGGYLFMSGDGESNTGTTGSTFYMNRPVFSYGFGSSYQITERAGVFIQGIGIAPFSKEMNNFGWDGSNNAAGNTAATYADVSTAIGIYTISMGLTIAV